MSLKFVRRLAAEVLKVGESRIWIDPDSFDRVSEVISREDVRRLIKDGVIKVRPKSTPSRGRLRMRRKRRRGPGSRKGSTISQKELWMAKVRAQRKFLKLLRRKRIIDRKTYRKLYMMVKGNAFRSVAHLKHYIIEHKLARRI